jgi:hypothetical protein
MGTEGPTRPFGVTPRLLKEPAGRKKYKEELVGYLGVWYSIKEVVCLDVSACRMAGYFKGFAGVRRFDSR